MGRRGPVAGARQETTPCAIKAASNIPSFQESLLPAPCSAAFTAHARRGLEADALPMPDNWDGGTLVRDGMEVCKSFLNLATETQGTPCKKGDHQQL